MTRIKFKWKGPVAAMALAGALVFGFTDAQAGDKSELQDVQEDGHFYYRIDRKAQSDIYGNRIKDLDIPAPFVVLPKNSPASCSHEVAIKIKFIRERLPHLDPKVMVYDSQYSRGQYYPHAVVVIKNPDGGWWVMNNRDMWLDKADNLDGYKNASLYTYEEALTRWARS